MKSDRELPATRSRLIVRDGGTVTVYEDAIPADVRRRIEAGIGDGSVRVSFAPRASKE